MDNNCHIPDLAQASSNEENAGLNLVLYRVIFTTMREQNRQIVPLKTSTSPFLNDSIKEVHHCMLYLYCFLLSNCKAHNKTKYNQPLLYMILSESMCIK